MTSKTLLAFALVFLLFNTLFIFTPTALAADPTYDWETATDNGNTVTQTINVDGSNITVTVSVVDNNSSPMGIGVLNAAGYNGTSGNVVLSDSTWDYRMTFSFSSPVNITSIYALESGSMLGSTWTYNPTGGSNSSVNDTIGASEGHTVNLNWSDVTSFTVTTADLGTGFAFDNLVLSTADVTAPTVSSTTPSNGATGVSLNSNITINLDEAVVKNSDQSEITNSDITQSMIEVCEGTTSGGTAVPYSAAIDGTKRVITIDPSSSFDYSSQYYVGIKANQLSDADGNTVLADSFTFTTQADTTPPSINITTSKSSPTSSAFTATFTFSEDVTGFSSGDIIVGNGSLSNFTNTTANRVWTALITPSANGLVTVDVNAGVCIDSANNGNTAATQLSMVYDNVKPSVVLSTTESNPTNNSPLTVTITFNEDVSGFTINDIDINNYSEIALYTITPNRVWDIKITPSTSGVVNVDVNADVCTDSAGNANTSASQLSLNYDATGPVASITTSETTPTNSSPFNITVTFDEDVSGFTIGDIIVGNGSASNLINTSANRVWTAQITPSSDGAVTVNINSGACTDSLGNNNSAAAQLSLTYDASSPTTAITSSESNPTSNSPIEVNITFSENVTGFSIGDIIVGSGSASNLTAVTDTRIFTADITPSAYGTITVDVVGGACQDAAGNNNYTASQFSITYQNTRPNRKSGVNATATADKTVGQAYTVNLADIFEDSNNDSLIYQVNIDAGGFVLCSENYSYTPLSAGVKTLVFRAYDGYDFSDDLYTVTLNVTAAPSPTVTPTVAPTATPSPTSNYNSTATPRPTATPEPTATLMPALTPSGSTQTTATPTVESNATPTPSDVIVIVPAQSDIDEDTGSVEIIINTSDLPEGTKAVKLPDGSVIEVPQDATIALTVNKDDLNVDGDFVIVALDDEEVALGSVNVDIGDTEEIFALNASEAIVKGSFNWLLAAFIFGALLIIGSLIYIVFLSKRKYRR